mmetsp:Transcript_6434/g.11775  ORF Transcript_6434/g.11775 Transcript_6434/m.11775 type:complete len:80 (-) Transcript_6434:224-463(-)
MAAFSHNGYIISIPTTAHIHTCQELLALYNLPSSKKKWGSRLKLLRKRCFSMLRQHHGELPPPTKMGCARICGPWRKSL